MSRQEEKGIAAMELLGRHRLPEKEQELGRNMEWATEILARKKTTLHVLDIPRGLG